MSEGAGPAEQFQRGMNSQWDMNSSCEMTLSIQMAAMLLHNETQHRSHC